MEEYFDWQGSTWPFTDLRGAVPARFVLEQVDDDAFILREGFRYVPRDGDPIEVTDETLPRTDFASIPSYLLWFVSRHGRHTPAVVLHDMLTRQSAAPADRVAADRHLLDALDACRVPRVRSRLMWAGVALATRWTTGPRERGGIIAWGATALAGTGLLVVGLRSCSVGLTAVALAGPFVGGVCWGRQYWAGVIGGYGLWLIALPAAVSVLGHRVYWLVEQVARAVLRLRRRGHGPAPAAPTSYKAA